MNSWLPHTGLRNISDRFRLSLDLRVVGRSDGVPIVGRLKAIDLQSLTVTQEEKDIVLCLDPDSYYRTPDYGGRLLDAGILDSFKIGDEVLIGYADNTVRSIRQVFLG